MRTGQLKSLEGVVIWVISRGTDKRKQYFCFYEDGSPRWSKHLWSARRFSSERIANEALGEIRVRRGKSGKP